MAGPVNGIEHPRSPVRARCYQLRTRSVEAHVQDLVVVSSECMNALPASDVPHLIQNGYADKKGDQSWWSFGARWGGWTCLCNSWEEALRMI